MKRIMVACLFSVFNLALFAQVDENEYHKFLEETIKRSELYIDADTLRELKDVVILDTREKQEFDVSHIKNAKNVGYLWFDMRNLYDVPKSSKIVLYCTVGNRSEKIAEKLKKAGYKNIHVLYGGMIEWVNRNKPIYRKDGVQTTEIHTFNEKWSHFVNRGAITY